MTQDKPNWKLLEECGEKLTREGKFPFSRRDLIECVHMKHPHKKEDSLNPIIQGMTVNAKGGAPGGRGKNVFYRVARGKYELYDPKKHGSISDTPTTGPTEKEIHKPSVPRKVKEVSYEETKTTEDEIRDLLMKTLYNRIGRRKSWKGSGKTASFDLEDKFKGYKCFAEQPTSYTIPSGSLDHTSDILISNREKRRYISLEIKHRSAVTDQFKCRAYDMIHLKKTYNDSLLGIMVYVKSTTGISVKHAKSICYPFDHFFGIPSNLRHNPPVWDNLVSAVVKFLKL